MKHSIFVIIAAVMMLSSCSNNSSSNKSISDISENSSSSVIEGSSDENSLNDTGLNSDGSYNPKYLDGVTDKKLIGVWQDPASDTESYVLFDYDQNFYKISMLVPDVTKDAKYDKSEGVLTYNIEDENGDTKEIGIQLLNTDGEVSDTLTDGIYIPYGVMNTSAIIIDNRLYEITDLNMYYTIKDGVITIHNKVAEALDSNYDVTKETMIKYKILEDNKTIHFSLTDINNTETQVIECSKETKFDNRLSAMIHAIGITNANL